MNKTATTALGKIYVRKNKIRLKCAAGTQQIITEDFYLHKIECLHPHIESYQRRVWHTRCSSKKEWQAPTSIFYDPSCNSDAWKMSSILEKTISTLANKLDCDISAIIVDSHTIELEFYECKIPAQNSPKSSKLKSASQDPTGQIL